MPTNCMKTATMIIFHSGGQEKKEIYMYISEKIFGG